MPRLTSTRQRIDEYRVIRLHGEGKSMKEIAQELGISVKTVRDTLRMVNEEWRERSLDQHEEWVRDELERLDRVERAAWTAFEATGKDSALNRVLAAINTRAKLLGLNMPEKVAQTDPDGKQAAPVVQVYLPHNQRDKEPKNMLEPAFGDAPLAYNGKSEPVLGVSEDDGSN